MTITEAGKNLIAALTGIYSQREVVNITAMVMEKLTGFSKSERLLHKNLLLDTVQQNQFDDLKKQLLQHKPVQYVLHEAWFCGLPFYVDESVLIPRPETEELVEAILQDLEPLNNHTLSVLDIGTGSGCIAVSLKKKLPDATVYALDISPEALSIAEKNALLSNVHIELLQHDILNFQPTGALPAFDIIVSNPPYILQQESQEMHSNVLQFEPHLALFVPDEDPLLFYKAIAEFSVQNLKRGKGRLHFEINERMGAGVTEMLTAKGFHGIMVKKDLQQKNRIVSAGLL